LNAEDGHIKAIALLSGGLDSTLAVKLMQERGIYILALNFVSPFCLCERRKGCASIAKYAARRLGVKVRRISLSRDYVEVLRRPRHGYGRNVNPCLDCRILMFKRARNFMDEEGASFIITGEVLGQRPMSQHLRAWAVIEREAGVEGLVVRPLSGGLLPPTLPEREGLIRREWLLSIRGRSRKPQMRLAHERGIDYYPCPAGGCLLTEPSFAPRVRDLLVHCQTILVNDLNLLRYGRHFRLSPTTKAIVGRSQDENGKLEKLARPGDLLLETMDRPGPVTLVRGSRLGDELTLAARIHARYSDGSSDARVHIRCRVKGGCDFEPRSVLVTPASGNEIEQLRI